MITRIRFKKPLVIENGDGLVKLLERVENEMGGWWETEGKTFGHVWRIYAVMRFEFEKQDFSRIS